MSTESRSTEKVRNQVRPQNTAPVDDHRSQASLPGDVPLSPPSPRWSGWSRALGGGWLGPYRVVALILVAALATFLLLRLGFLLVFSDWRNLSGGEIVGILWVGFRFDLLIGLCFVLTQTLHLTLVPHRRLLGLVSRSLLEFEWLFACIFLPLMCVVEWLFFDEFQSRLNYIAFEYLVYPTEVFTNIWESYAVVPYLSIVAIFGGAVYFLARRPFLRLMDVPTTWQQRWGILLGTVSLIVGLWLTNGVQGQKISRDRVANECAGNGLYSFVYYAWTCHFNFEDNYITLDEATALRRLREQVVRKGDRLIEGSVNPVDRIVETHRPLSNFHVVLILEESLGSDFIGALGDQRGLTPHFDELTGKGILFDHFFATGNRTARALEAVLTSMPPIPTESILKRDHSDRVYTLANVLAERGYQRIFMYAGRGLFDGVRSFMTANGFDQFIEQSDFDHPVFSNAWGVSDEDLFRKALGELDRLDATGNPFFATLLTVSNHRPFTFPPGRIPETGQTRQNAVKYADWALGYFFREARSHAWYDHTVFVVLGDHGARIYGSQLFPMKSYRVPVLMILPGGEKSGTRSSTLACSLDIAPTIMGRLGGQYRSVFFGSDALEIEPSAGRAIMQHNHDVTLLDSKNHMVVLGYGKSAQAFQLDAISYGLDPTDQADPEKLQDAAALFQSAYRLYYNDRWFPDHSVESKRPRVANAKAGLAK